MLGSGRPPSLSGCQDAIEELMRADASFAQVEDAIESVDLTPDDKAALWVLAWSSIDLEATRHQELEQRLAPVG